MKNDFKPVVDHRFSLCADWGAVDCQVLAVEPNKTLSYTWAAYSRASGWIRSKPTRAPRAGGSSSLRRCSRYWRG